MEKFKDWAYTKRKIIGIGGFSTVYQCRDKKKGQDVAIKVVSIPSEHGVDGYTIREVSLLKEMDHANIVKLLDLKCSGKFVYLVFEHLHTDLHKLVASSPRTFIDPVFVKKFLQQILQSLEYCHSHNVLHRDIKPSNFLTDKDNKIVKLADFGLARSIEVPALDYSFEAGTFMYCAPELLLGSCKYSTSIDIWSVGCIFGEMVKQKPLFSAINAEDNFQMLAIDQYLNVIFSLLGTPTEETWPGLTSLYEFLPRFRQYEPKNLAEEFTDLEQGGVDLLSKMLQLDPTKRITAHAALQHPYFQGV